MYMQNFQKWIRKLFTISNLLLFLLFFPSSGATGLGKSTMVNTLFKGRLSRMSSTGAAAAIPKTVEVKSVSHGMMMSPCSLKGIIISICTIIFRSWQTKQRAINHPGTCLNPLYSDSVNVLIETLCYFLIFFFSYWGKRCKIKTNHHWHSRIWWSNQ